MPGSKQVPIPDSRTSFPPRAFENSSVDVVTPPPPHPLTRSSAPPAFTLIEVLVAVAILVIILGLMVSLARYVRVQSAERMTRDLLVQLDLLMAQYHARHDRLPAVSPLIDPDTPADEPALQENALRNSEQFVQALRQLDLSAPAADLRLPETGPLRDAWGSPIVLVPQWDPAIDLGMAPRDRFFFLSAGPDRQFLTRQDNLYSYEEGE
jgi:prepilin-type N-terminal cleavage/methylation domain-containing protein